MGGCQCCFDLNPKRASLGIRRFASILDDRRQNESEQRLEHARHDHSSLASIKPPPHCYPSNLARLISTFQHPLQSFGRIEALCYLLEFHVKVRHLGLRGYFCGQDARCLAGPTKGPTRVLGLSQPFPITSTTIPVSSEKDTPIFPLYALHKTKAHSTWRPKGSC